MAGGRATHVCVVLGLLAGVVALSAQQAPPAGTDETASFEVASVKPNTSRVSNGEFDVDLRFTPDSSPAAAPEFPSIFTAVQEQLGLKLLSERAPVPVLVIDSVQRPTPD